ncbi:MAG: FliG C-terminal domain-containing protein [Phycisphaerales bacterium]|jgi:flagellar motor switch protein FliG
MAVTNKQKAAMMLMTLDPSTASDLLRTVNPETVRELAVELAYLDAAGYANTQQSIAYAKEFCSSLRVDVGFRLKEFLGQMLTNTIGQEKAQQIQNEISGLLQQRDPFIPLRSAEAPTIASALRGEHPQAIAIILSELSAKKSSEVLKLLDEQIRQDVIARMTSGERLTAESKTRIVEMICHKLKSLKTEQGPAAQQLHPEQSLRKVAIILRNLSQELREGLLNAIRDRDPEAVEKVTNLMIVWDDIPIITDRSLQEILRQVEAKDLALALTKADETTVKKIRSNISERAVQTLDEETSLMSAPTKQDINSARERIVDTLREHNQSGNLTFIEE